MDQSFNKNDSIYVCIEYINNKYYLYFRKNNKIIEYKDDFDNANILIDKKRIELDFETHDYLFALSSVRCSCACDDTKNWLGYELEIEFSTLTG